MYKRKDKVAFLGVTSEGTTTYMRMTGFTEFSESKNAKEYTRQYVDEEFERSDVVGYSPSVSYAFDYDGENAAHGVIVDITEGEKIGDDALVDIVLVDLGEAVEGEGCSAKSRSYSVIPGTEGDKLEAYTYSGTLKANGSVTKGNATSADGWKTCTFTAAEA